MRILDLILWLLFFGVVFTGAIAYQSVKNSKPVLFEPFEINDSTITTSNNEQFLPNMRFSKKEISYSLSEKCNENKMRNLREAFFILEDLTNLTFYPVNENPEIKISCSSVIQPSNKSGYFVAGEGGPGKVINATNYAIIYEGELALFRNEACNKPNIALHEILHVLGYDHNNNKRSIMYPTTGCNQVIDEYIINSINKLYSVEPLPDIVIKKANATKKGGYVDFEISISNYGLDKSEMNELIISSEEEEINRTEIKEIDVGVERKLWMKNLKFPKNSNKIIFYIKSDKEEISYSNNKVELVLDEPIKV